MKILTSDNKLILNEGKKYNFFNFKRSKKLSGDKVSDFDVIKNVLMSKKLKNKFDYLIYLQPTSIVRNKTQLLNAFSKIIKYNYDATWSVSKIDKKFHPLKVFNIKKKIKPHK